MMPLDSEDLAPRVCNGNVFRRKNATIVKVNDGGTVHGIDLEVPLSGLHTLSGHVEAVADGHAPSQATITLLYADDREQARKAPIDKDGSFAFEYVPEDNYVLRVSDAEDTPGENGDSEQSDGASGNGPSQVTRHYQTKEMPLRVQSDMKDLDVSLTAEAAARPQ